MNYIKTSDIEWKKVGYLRQGQTTAYDYWFYLNEPLASWDVWDYWERERIESMRTHLTQDDILFDIGTEQGWCNLVYATMIKPSNIVLIEPTQEFWPNIKALWRKNYGVEPLAFYDGLLSDKTTDKRKTGFKQWPKASSGDLIDRNKYQYIHANDEDVPEMTIDDYVRLTGITPTALTMDTEGSELLILKGAEKTLRDNKLKVWVSIHDDLGRRDYDVSPDDTRNFLKSLGYKGEYLATDHEIHEYWHKP